MQGLDSGDGKDIPANVQDQECTKKDEEIAASSIEGTAEELQKAPFSEEDNEALMNEDAEEHHGTNADELEEATPQIDGDNFKLSTFIPAGFKMRKSRSRSTHNGSDHVHLPKTRSGPK